MDLGQWVRGWDAHTAAGQEAGPTNWELSMRVLFGVGVGFGVGGVVAFADLGFHAIGFTFD
jgi:hypothetical protein